MTSPDTVLRDNDTTSGTDLYLSRRVVPLRVPLFLDGFGWMSADGFGREIAGLPMKHVDSRDVLRR
jgi:hypothetical protein